MAPVEAGSCTAAVAVAADLDLDLVRPLRSSAGPKCWSPAAMAFAADQLADPAQQAKVGAAAAAKAATKKWAFGCCRWTAFAACFPPLAFA